MRGRYVLLHPIEQEAAASDQAYRQFVSRLQMALLTALKEHGCLKQGEYAAALERLGRP